MLITLKMVINNHVSSVYLPSTENAMTFDTMMDVTRIPNCQFIAFRPVHVFCNTAEATLPWFLVC